MVQRTFRPASTFPFFVRRFVWTASIACAATLWIDILLWRSGDSGPTGWLFSASIPQLFLIPPAVVAILAWRRKAHLLTALGLTLSILQIFGPMGLCFGRPSDQPADLRVMTYNIGQFESGKTKNGLPALADTIRTENPDVVCLQEAHASGPFWKGDRLAPQLAQQFPGYQPYIDGGIMLLSKLPLLHTETKIFESHLGGHWNVQEVTFNVSGEPIRLINLHMIPDGYVPPWWPKITWIDSIERKRRLRQEEFGEIVGRVQATPGPVIVCGDFNLQPVGPDYRLLTENLTDTFRATHLGFGYTLTSKYPTKRVDYIWTRALRPLRSKVVLSDASDHMPLVADLALR